MLTRACIVSYESIVHRRREKDWILHETEALLLGIKELLDEARVERILRRLTKSMNDY